MRTLYLKYPGKCSCCGGTMKRGELAEYDPIKKQVWHYGAPNGDSGKCYGVLKNKQSRDFVDIDRMYEDQCADICGR